MSLGDELAREIDREPVGLSCDALARRVHRRRAIVLAALNADPRFQHEGNTHGSRWRRAAVSLETRPIPSRDDPSLWASLDPSGIPIVGRGAESAS
jgi:hypothetical protein